MTMPKLLFWLSDIYIKVIFILKSSRIEAIISKNKRDVYSSKNQLKELVFSMTLGFRSCLIDNKRKDRFREVNIKEFNTIGYFIKCYFNWSMNYAELEDCIENFLTREKEENRKAFKNEIERMYMLNDPELIRKVAYELGDRGIPTDKTLYMIKLLYTKTQQEKK